MKDFSPFVSPWWLRGAHLQTLSGHFLRSPTDLSEKLPRIEIPLSGSFDRLVGELIVADSKASDSQEVLVILFHGLTGNSSSVYMRRFGLSLSQHGFSVLLMNHRDCGIGEGLAQSLFHSGRGEDVSDVVQFCRINFPQKKLVVVGFSLSGNALLCLMTGKRGTSLPDAGISVNAPIDLLKSSLELQKSFNRIYDRYFVRALSQLIRKKKLRSSQWESVDLTKIKNLYEFDDKITAPLSGFSGGARDYYHQCSTYLDLNSITLPTWLVHSSDDPFVPVESYRQAKLKDTPCVLSLQSRGGHMGFMKRGAGALQLKPWLEEALPHWIQQALL
jgi:predicted alpha/beta-fold hydrolase